jgi:hypothetical protein
MSEAEGFLGEKKKEAKEFQWINKSITWKTIESERREREMGIAGSRESYSLFVWHGHTLCVEKGWFICSRAICLLMRERYLRQQHTQKKRKKRESKGNGERERNEITECDNSPSIVCDRKDSNVFE